MPKYGLLGYPLSHSFSKIYFEKKFALAPFQKNTYELFERKDLKDFRSWFFEQQLKGLNVTIPHKISVLAHLDRLAPCAAGVGAVNVIALENQELIGYNTDVSGFEAVFPKDLKGRALVLGTGGAALAVQAALKQRGIEFKTVSRKLGGGDYTYENLLNLSEFESIINATPLGMYPNVSTYPALDFSQITDLHYGFDLVYNPEKTIFLSYFSRGQNGLAMLYAQAEAAWKIWSEVT
jgi:shikimate dehydrogenase